MDKIPDKTKLQWSTHKRSILSKFTASQTLYRVMAVNQCGQK